MKKHNLSAITRIPFSSEWKFIDVSRRRLSAVLALLICAKDKSTQFFVVLVFPAAKSDFSHSRSG
jgi:hypothetical protein